MLKRSFAGVLAVMIVFLMMVSCDESGNTTFSVDFLEFTSERSDSLSIYFTSASGPLLFTGDIEIIDGRCDILLVNPENDTVFYNTYLPNETVTINEKFDPINGYWKFNYRLGEYEEELPFGNLEFQFTYEN